MPLVRYELRPEHSLANPELFRSAARDDPESLLEGVAMAGLIGIVRQLGDLAEFAAEVFRDLHEEFVSVGGRAHDLTVRVQQLEAELPSVEKALLSEPNQLRFAYTHGADWHASIRSDQNHCTSGELPRFVRNFYQECRGPPRLFLLDKFDVAGAGACLKRYSDPSFFKLEWASSELMKAQRAQRDKKARREKKKGRRRKTGQPIAAINQIPARVRYGSASLEDLDSLSHLLAPTLKNEVGSSSSNQGVKNGRGAHPQRRSNLGPQNKVVGGPLSPTGGVPLAQPDGGASESLKISAKGIEANVSGKFYQPTESENAAASMAGKISKIIEMEDRDAMPPVALLPRNVDNKSLKCADELIVSDPDIESKGTNGVGKEGPEATMMGRSENTSPGILRENVSMVGKEGSNLGDCRVSQSSLPDVLSNGSATLDAKEEANSSDLRTQSTSGLGDAGSAGSQEASSRTSSTYVRDLGQLPGKASRRNFVDAKEAHVIAARFPRQNSGKSSRGTDDLANAPATYASEHRSGTGSLKKKISGDHDSQNRQADSHLNHVAHGHGNLLQHENLPHVPDAGHAVEEHKHSISEVPAGASSAPTTADKYEEPLVSASGGELAFHDVHPLETQRPAKSAVDIREVSNKPEEAVNNLPHFPPIRVKEILANEEELTMISATSPKVSSQCSSPGEISVRPSLSMLSRLSYSSELMPVSSDSEPGSPVSPNSPTFNALYSPPGSPSRILGAMVESPSGIYMGPYSRTAYRSSHGSSRSGIPVLSLSPRSQMASSSAVSWADQGDHAAPLRPPPPLPIVITTPENPPHFDSRQELRSLESQPFHSPSSSLDAELGIPTSSKADGVPSQSNEEPSHLSSSQENAGKVHLGAGGSPENPDLLPIRTYLEASSEHVEPTQYPAVNLEAEVLSPSKTSSPAVTEPLKSSSPEHILESRSVDVLSDGPIDSLPTPSGELEACLLSKPLQGTPPCPASSEVSVQHSPCSLGQALNTAPSSISVEDEESVPSSPTGSVIIKDTPSLPGSPASNYSDNEPEIHEYHPSLGPVSPRSIEHALEDVINHRETSSGDASVHEDLIFESSEREPTIAGSVQETGLLNSLSGNEVQVTCLVPEDHEEAFEEPTSTHLDIFHEEPRPEATPTSTLSATTRTPTPTLDLQAQTIAPSISSPPDSPARKPQHPPEEDEPGTGRSPSPSPSESETRRLSGASSHRSSKSEIMRIPSAASSQRSASNSPPTSPPKFGDHASSSLRWRRRSDKPDFSLPPNLVPDLVCLSETSSPPCSPPPLSDLESPKQWDEGSEVSSVSESSDLGLEWTHGARKADGSINLDVYRLPDSPLPPDSPTMSEDGDRLSKQASSSRRMSDFMQDDDDDDDDDDDVVSLQEHDEVVEIGMERSESQVPSQVSSQKVPSDSPVCLNPSEEAMLPGSDLLLNSSSEKALSSDSEIRINSFPEKMPSADSELFFNSSLEEMLSSDGHHSNEAEVRPSTEYALQESLLQVDNSRQSAFENQTNLNQTNDAREGPAPLTATLGSTGTPSQDAMAAAIAHHDWNMMKALSYQDPGHGEFSPPGGKSIVLEEGERKDPVIGPYGNINVAAILEKANAIRQAFVGSDGEGDDEDDWSDA